MTSPVPELRFHNVDDSGEGRFNRSLTLSADSVTESSNLFDLHPSTSPKRAQLEEFIARRFNLAYGAAIVEFFPLLLSRNHDEKLASVVGLRPGTDRPLFLEQYLDQPLEHLLLSHAGEIVDRNELIEIGNLASSCRAGNQLTFVLLTAILARAGYSWVVFTATAQVRSLLRRLRFEPLTLGEAEANRLTNKLQHWGTYYQSRPQVQAGSLALGMSILEGEPDCRELLNRHASEINRLAAMLRIVRQQGIRSHE